VAPRSSPLASRVLASGLMWKRLAAKAGGSAIAVFVWALAAVIGHPIDLDSKPQVVAIAGDKAHLLLSEILSRMMAHRRWQDSALREYQLHRLFHASNTRFNIDSMMEVETKFRSPGTMESTVIRQEGSAFIREHVFQKILSAESELSSNTNADLIPDNYQFTLVGPDACEGRRCWHLTLKPRHPDKYLLEGDVWLDAEDYAVCHVHGTPSRHVSIWISRAVVDWRFKRMDTGVWLTEAVESTSDVRLFGPVLMQIQYGYRNIDVASVAKNGI
jgi:hypothetical protein